MATNGTLSSAGGSSSNDNVTLNLTYAAIGLSVGAIFLSVLQALLAYLQFDISEVGTRRCSKEVMGSWALKTTRSFNWRQLRFQVFYEIPVLYTAPPGITVGPLNRMQPQATFRDRFHLNNNLESDEKLLSIIQVEVIDMEEVSIHEHIEPIYKITGTETSCKNTLTKLDSGKWAQTNSLTYERCSWVDLLSAMQVQEKTSRAWDNTCLPEGNPGHNHTICYLMQKRKGCWDLMPPSATRPFAVTTVCHLVEIISMLGLVWTEFDMKRSTLRAEGNGYMINSEHMPGLGVLTRFSQVERPNNKENRIVPCIELKRLCFGQVPSIFDSIRETVQVSPKKLETSLMQILPQLGERHRHQFLNSFDRPLIFPSIFELIAMVARSVHLTGSRFRRLPTPCAANWTPGLDFASCLSYFATAIENSTTIGSHALAEELRSVFKNGRLGTLLLSNGQTLREKLSSYSSAKTTLAAEQKGTMYWPSDYPQRLQEAKDRYDNELLDLLDSLHWIIEWIDERLKDNIRAVKEVLALHFAAVFDNQQALNTHLTQYSNDDPKEDPKEDPKDSSNDNPRGNENNSHKYNPKEKILIDFYFGKIHSNVTKEVPEEGSEDPGPDPGDRDQRSAIWVALVFRMLAWLVLHDFNPEDSMIERSEFMNSRLPMYIG